MSSLGQYLAAGNTMPGGFASGDSTLRGGFASTMDGDDDSPAPSPHKGKYGDPAKYAGTGQAAPFMGDATTKLYLSFVNDMVEQQQQDNFTAIRRPEMKDGRPHLPPSPRAAAPPPPPGPPPKWEINDDLMHQKWGSVLRTLQPNQQNQSMAPLLPQNRVNHAPAFLTGKSYRPGGAARAGAPSGSPRWGAPLSARPSLV